MTSDSVTRFRLSIWRPARLDGVYLYATGGTSGTNHSSFLDPSTVLEQIYTWDPGPYDLDLSCTTKAAKRIADGLLRPFGEHRPPAKRSVPYFTRALHELLEDPELQTGTFWSDCEETITDGDSVVNVRANTPLGVLRHCLWIARVYADVPDASVLIR